jgi:uncharacterized protein (DUF58 family)
MDRSELLRKVRTLEIRSKGLSKHLFSGEYHSAFKGRGMTFSEVREYQHGDDVRTIDWNVTARTRNPHVKVFEEERELTIFLLFDLSESMEFGSDVQTKKELAVEIAATLAFSAIANNDKVGAILFTDDVEQYFTPNKGRKHVLQILISALQHQKKGKTTNILNALQFIERTQKKRSICFLISDFTTDEMYLEAIQRIRKKHDTIALHIADPKEYHVPERGFIQFFNAETSTTTWMNMSDPKVREKLQEFESEKITELTQNMLRAGVNLVSFKTNEEIRLPLLRLFKNRS